MGIYTLQRERDTERKKSRSEHCLETYGCIEQTFIASGVDHHIKIQ